MKAVFALLCLVAACSATAVYTNGLYYPYQYQQSAVQYVAPTNYNYQYKYVQPVVAASNTYAQTVVPTYANTYAASYVPTTSSVYGSYGYPSYGYPSYYQYLKK